MYQMKYLRKLILNLQYHYKQEGALILFDIKHQRSLKIQKKKALRLKGNAHKPINNEKYEYNNLQKKKKKGVFEKLAKKVDETKGAPS